MIEELLKELDLAILEFNKAIPSIQGDIFDRVQEIIRELDTKASYVEANVKNLKRLNKIQVEINKIVLNPAYKKSVIKFTESFEKIAIIQNEYFAAMTEEFTVTEVLKEIKKQAINDTIISLTEEGLNANVSNKIKELLSDNVKTGMKWKDINKELKIFIEGNEETAGVLEKYTDQITTDAIHEFSANYSQIVTDDLGLEWHIYAGNVITDSRDLCVHLVKKEFIHKSELPDILKGNIDGVQIPISKKTKLPYGMKAGTNVDNFPTRRGGYRCRHQYVPISKFIVPKEIREEFE